MRAITEPKLTFADKLRGWWDSDYAARSSVNRRIAARPWLLTGDRRGGSGTRLNPSPTNQQFGPNQTRTLTPQKRKHMVQVSRTIDENNILGSSMLDSAVDNIIGTGMVLQAMTPDEDFNEAVEAKWKDYGDKLDARGVTKSHGHWQRLFYRGFRRDGDIGGLLLRDGTVQTIETDYIQTPGGPGDRFDGRDGRAEIIDGVEINRAGRHVRYHIALEPSSFRTEYAQAAGRNFVFLFDNGRLDRRATRGVPVMAMMGWLLDQIDGTVEAVTVAHRMAAMFGIVHKRKDPAAAFAALGTTAMNIDGNEQNERVMEPGMYEYAGIEDDLVQIRPDHPTTSFADFMSLLTRLAGRKMGLPLELAMMDFSRTNYSSARASMEQAYRGFRVQQKLFADCVLSRLYRWRVSKWVKDGELDLPASIADDFWRHRWLAQPWPYLDPQKEAEGDLIAVDAGHMTLGDVLMKRGYEFGDWIDQRKREIDAIEGAGIPLVMSNKTRDAGGNAQSEPAGDTNDDTEADED